MKSILKRISQIHQSEKQIKQLAHIHFDLDEPEFLIKKKFENVFNKAQNSRCFHTSHSCKMCDNIEISSHAKFCRICGFKFSNE